MDTEDEKKALKALKVLEGELAKGNTIDVRSERIRFGHLLDLLLADYVNNNRKSLKHTKSRIEGVKGEGGHIRPALGDRRAITINSADLMLYISKRKDDGATNGTVNRELVLIKRAFTLAWRAYRLPGPHIELLQETNVRVGFVERPQLDAICSRLPEYLIPVVQFGFLTGWRVSEIRNLQWKDVNFEAGEIRLEPGTTKNNEGRMIKMTTELRSLLAKLHETRPQLFPWVFVRRFKKSKRILPVGDFRKVWDKACTAAGFPGRIFHDLRRSAVRQFVRTGISERVAMKMTGHKTREVFDRYQIVSEGDLTEAAEKIDAGTVAGTIRKSKRKAASK
jgi:integrase